MILVPEIQTVVILVPRTGSGSLKRAVAERYPRSMLIYRHMEADGVPLGYDRWRKVGVVRHPVERLWSLYRFLKNFRGSSDPLYEEGNRQTYLEKQRRSVECPFDEWIVRNEIVFTSPYDSDGLNRFWPHFSVRHALPETRKSQFLYLRPDLGTEIYPFAQLSCLFRELDVDGGHFNASGCVDPPPPLSAKAMDHLARFFAWDLEQTGAELE